jgi:Ion channel
VDIPRKFLDAFSSMKSEVSRRQELLGSSRSEQLAMFPDFIRDLRHLRSERIDWLLTLLTVVLALLIFVVAPLNALGISAFHLFAICLLLAIIGGMVIISNSPTALLLMSIALVANLAVFFLRLYYPVPFHLHILSVAWLIIAGTLGIVVTQAVFRLGRVTYHRIVGAVLLYLLIAVAFATLFAFVGLSHQEAIKGIAFDDDQSLASALFYMSFVTLTSTGYGDIVPVHPIARSLCNVESVIGQLYPATLLARLVTLELREPSR